MDPGDKDGRRLWVAFEHDLEIAAHLTTSDTTTETMTSAELDGDVAVHHQLVVDAAADPVLLGCDCPPPQLEVRIGEPVSLGAGAGDEEKLMPGCADGVDAEIRFDGTIEGIKRKGGDWVRAN